MEFKVGSLMNLISGKSEIKGPLKESGEEKIVFKHKARAPFKMQSGPANNVDESSKEKLAVKPKIQSVKSLNFKGKSSTLRSLQKFQEKFKRDTLKKSFKNHGITQENKPEFVENSSETVVGKSFKYINYENTSNTGDTTDGNNSDDKLERTIFVGNLPLTQISDKSVRKLFAPFGEIESFRLRSVPLKDLRFSRKIAAIKADFHPDRTSTNTYVVMKSKVAAEAALALNGTVLDGHHLRVDFASSPKENDPKKSIFLGNVSFKAEEDDLWSLFEQCGDIEYVRIIRDKETSVSKGAAYVNFKSADSVELALKMEGTAELNGRILKIHRCLPGRKKSFHTVSSRQPDPRNTKVDVKKDEKTRKKEEERFHKKMKRREKRDAENSKNEAMGMRSRPLRDPSTKSAANSFVGVKADGVKQKKKKKKFNKGEVQRKKVAKILASVKSEGRKVNDHSEVVDIDEQSGSSSTVTTPASPKSTKKPKKLLQGKVTKKTAQRTVLLEHKGEIIKKKLKKVKTKHA